jgi:ATP-dependent exoDNAse (exonuclease V) beta subunit
MTVHKAKGLEFPVVILCDMTAKDSREPTKWIDQAAGLSAMSLAGCTPIEVQEHAAEEIAIEKEEAARVLYVAATRARDLLVVCAVGDQPTEDWLATLNPVLYPEEVSSFKPETKQASGCPVFSDDTVVGRPQSAFRPLGSVSPGLHKPRVGEHRVVWWDPSVLAPPSQGRTSSKLTEFLKKDDAVRAPAGIREHEEWQSKRKFVREVASKPQWSVVTATSQTLSVDEANLLAEPGAELVSEVSIKEVGTDFSRPHGKRFGTLVHSVLSVVALDADTEGIVKVARVQGRVLGANEEEIEAAVETVAAVLRNPIVSGASGRCRREVPVTVRLENDLIVEGVVDLAYQASKDGDVWTVVDYKTDFELGGRSKEYSRQVWLYALAISRATGKKSHPVLLRV